MEGLEHAAPGDGGSSGGTSSSGGGSTSISSSGGGGGGAEPSEAAAGDEAAPAGKRRRASAGGGGGRSGRGAVEWVCRLAGGGGVRARCVVLATGGFSFPAVGTDGTGEAAFWGVLCGGRGSGRKGQMPCEGSCGAARRDVAGGVGASRLIWFV